MGPLTGEIFRTNAFRTLGLSGLADQAAVQSAARRMRIWPDARNIPATPWDFPRLGPIARAKIDIEKAVACLNQPASRLQQRLLWFATTEPPDPTNPIGQDDGGAGSPCGHTRIVVAMHDLFLLNPTVFRVGQWPALMGTLLEFSESVTVLDWLVQVEQSGNFEKQVSEIEIREAVNALPAALAGAMVARAQNAMKSANAMELKEIVSALRMAGDRPNIGRQVGALFDSLEDSIMVACRMMDAYLRERLRTNHSNPAPFFEQNLPRAAEGTKFYETRIRDQLELVTDVIGDEPDRLTRVRSACGKELALLGLAWEWSGRFNDAATTYDVAADLAAGTPLQRKYQQAAEKCRQPRPRRAVKSNRKRRLVVALACFVFLQVVLRFNALNSQNHSDRVAPYYDLTAPAYNVSNSAHSQDSNDRSAETERNNRSEPVGGINRGGN